MAEPGIQRRHRHGRAGVHRPVPQLAVKIFPGLAEKFIRAIAELNTANAVFSSFGAFLENRNYAARRLLPAVPLPLALTSPREQFFAGDLFEFIVARVHQLKFSFAANKSSRNASATRRALRFAKRR